MSSLDLLVALDIETTGLDPDRDAIIEIGAVKFDLQGVAEPMTWHSLVNPGRPLTAFIVDLTGIRQEDVDRAPALSSVLGGLLDFVGDYPVVGHNIGFDLSFFQRRGYLRENQPLDTVELASVLFPGAGRYTLSALVHELGLASFEAHRGLADALAARDLFLALRDRALALPNAILAEIAETGEGAGWLPAAFFQEVLRSKTLVEGNGFPSPRVDIIELLPESAEPPLPLRAQGTVEPLDAQALGALLEPGGLVAEALDGFEHRLQQVTVLRAVCEAFNTPSHLLVEAGTGTGKSLAYLIPSIYHAVNAGQRVVISTNTIALQDQLLGKDIPDLQRCLPFDFRAAVLKGRANYLCPRRFEALRHSGVSGPEEMRLLAKLLVWLPTTQTGDRAELTLLGPGEQFAWSRVSADSEGCSADRCAGYLGGACPFWRARQAAEGAHVLIVNHALLLSDVVTGGHVLPEYKYLVVDEAHHLEEATTHGLSFHADRSALERMLAELGSTRLNRAGRPGLLPQLVHAVHGAMPDDMANELRVYANRLLAGITVAERQAAEFFGVLGEFLAEQREQQRQGYEGGVLRLLLDHGMRIQPGWSSVEDAWETASVQLFALLDGLKHLVERLSDLEQFEIPGWEDILLGLMSVQRQLTDLRGQMTQAATQPSPAMIYWAESEGRQRYASLHAAPLHVGPLVEEHLFHAKTSVVLTSATLRAGDDFAFVRDRLHAWDADELAVDSPFDYERSTLLYVTSDLPEPNQPGYQAQFERGLLELCKATHGRALVLFTSYSQLRATSQAISAPLAEAGIVVYEQSDGSSRRQLLDNFRDAERAVLLGTRSFWEGVDVPGEALSVVVLPRLPFSVPSDPVFIARSRTFDDAFNEYAVPEAVLRFRQGFGRLIRRQSDRGVVAVFDKRVISKAYGRQFLEALPVCTTRRGSIAQLSAAAQQWLDVV
jgi:ATP-dependent DNA helicase DinG